MPVLIQVNIGNEPQKGGVAVENLMSFARYAADLPGLDIRGLMAVMPDLRDEDALRPYFKHMRHLYEQLQCEAIGSAIFGARAYQENDLKGETHS